MVPEASRPAFVLTHNLTDPSGPAISLVMLCSNITFIQTTPYQCSIGLPFSKHEIMDITNKKDEYLNMITNRAYRF